MYAKAHKVIRIHLPKQRLSKLFIMQDWNRRDRDRDRGNDRGDFRGDRDNEIFSKKVKAGKRTYFFDVKSTRGKDFYITITESKKSFEGHYHKSKVFLYKEDFNKFMEALNETVMHVKSELMPDYNFDEYTGGQQDSYNYSSDDDEQDQDQPKDHEGDNDGY